MMKPFLAALVLLSTVARAQTPAPQAPAPQASPVKVSLDARGDDVREVIATLFAQAKKPYALDASIKGKLYVTLNAMPFDKALGIVLTQASLVAKMKDGVTLIVPAPKPAPTPVVVPKSAPVSTPPSPTIEKKPIVGKKAVVEKQPVPVDASPKVTTASLVRARVTTRLTRAPLADVFAAFGDQGHVTIELDPSVPPYKVDAFFIKTSLKFALDRVCKAAKLEYDIEDDRIVVRKA